MPGFVYKVNSITCAKKACAGEIKSLIDASEEIKIRKSFSETSKKDNSRAILSDSFLTLKSTVLRRVLSEGAGRYAKLIDLALNVVDSILDAEDNYGLHAAELNLSLQAYFHFLYDYLIEKDSPLRHAQIRFWVTYYTCLTDDLCFALYESLHNPDGQKYIQKYDKKCLPLIIFPKCSSASFQTHMNLELTERYVQDILEHHEEVRLNIKNNPHLMPFVRACTLATIEKITAAAEKMAREIKCFNEEARAEESLALTR